MKRFPAPPRTPLITILALSSAALGACQAQPDRHLGDSIDDRSLELIPPSESGEPTEPFSVLSLEFVGRWVGVAEDPLAFGGPRETYVFPSGSTQFNLEIAPSDQPGDFSLGGSLVFGSGAPLPPLDPELGPPSDVDYGQLAYLDRNAVTASSYEGPLPPYEGHPYLIRETVKRTVFNVDDEGNPIVADGVLQLEFDTASLIAPWCELQEPQLAFPERFSCVKGNTSLVGDFGECLVSFSALTPELEAEVLASGVTLAPEEVDCNKYFICASRICVCEESSCYYNAVERRSLVGKLILRREGDTLSGTFINTAFLNARQLPVPLGTVRFTRVED